MQQRKTFNLDSKTVEQAERVAQEKSVPLTRVVQDALQFYCDSVYLNENATFLNEQILGAFTAQIHLLERRLNNRTNKLLSELAIQQGITAMILANNVEVDHALLEQYRILAIQQLKQDNRVFRLEDLAGV